MFPFVFLQHSPLLFLNKAEFTRASSFLQHSRITSLPASIGTPKRLLALVREHWGIENGLHYRRDRSLREDDSQLRMGHAPHLLAILNNTALSLFAHRGETNLPRAQRDFAYHLDRFLARRAD
jgi:hypothetical protein